MTRSGEESVTQRFDNTCALITGGSRGIGAAVARRLAAEGAAVADPDEIAAAIAFLASRDAAYINGSTLAADGAWM
jgi:3-oxoacyl-[acyl-carrier protein] reductase